MAGNCKSQQLPREAWKREEMQPHYLSHHGGQTHGIRNYMAERVTLEKKQGSPNYQKKT